MEEIFTIFRNFFDKISARKFFMNFFGFFAKKLLTLRVLCIIIYTSVGQNGLKCIIFPIYYRKSGVKMIKV